eukprot:gnl/TRDRNA2_/TRDRNA2_147131_c0_seq1.p1 gnl/TRDRNA2_/TRDRNA2_147131_c0~~gnl/TRDRNA2_/TRDRNA2_147131_c0_seq1.p1  ORF type:complete len:1031 (-),score=153.96 gnl/TRDRNA2_/TRDRNA2_147131_c0_seq1:297-3098(-)
MGQTHGAFRSHSHRSPTDTTMFQHDPNDTRKEMSETMQAPRLLRASPRTNYPQGLTTSVRFLPAPSANPPHEDRAKHLRALKLFATKSLAVPLLNPDEAASGWLDELRAGRSFTTTMGERKWAESLLSTAAPTKPREKEAKLSCPSESSSGPLQERKRKSISFQQVGKRLINRRRSDDFRARVDGGVDQVSVISEARSSRKSTKRDTFSVEKLACKQRQELLAHVDGGPDLEGLLARLKGDCKGFTCAESTRMHTVFNRYLETGNKEVHVDHLHKMFTDLGYQRSTEQVAKEIALQLTPYSEINFEEFVACVEKYDGWEQAEFKRLFEMYDEDQSGTIDSNEVATLMSALGYTPFQTAVKEMMTIVDTDGSGHLDSDGFNLLMAVFRATEGFTRAEILHFRHVFGQFAIPTSSGEAEMSVEQLCSALKYSFGPQSADLARRVEDKIRGTVDSVSSSGTLQFQEFLAWSRQMREAEIVECRHLFDQFDADGGGTIGVDELPDMMRQLGYTPLEKKIRELLDEVDEDGNAELDFEEFVNMMAVYRETDGFTHQELDQFRQAFNAFDYDRSSRVDALELKDLLRYLGYIVNLEYVHRQIAKLKADLNESHELDFREFLRMMRMHREDELSRIHNAFYAKTRGAKCLPSSKVISVLESLGPLPSSPEVNCLLQEAREVAEHNFDSFVDIADDVRGVYVRTMRKHAGFVQDEIDFFKEAFDAYDRDGSKTIEKEELASFLSDNHVEMKTVQDQLHILVLIRKAQKLAGESHLGEAKVGFWTLVQLMRMLQDENERKEEERNMHAQKTSGFSLQEVEDLRQVFGHWTKKMEQAARSDETGEEPEKAPSWISRKSLDAALHVPSRLSLDGLRSILHSIGVQTSGSQRDELRKRWMGLNIDEEQRIDFPDFLAVWRWLIDSDFARINTLCAAPAHKSHAPT